MNAAPDQNPVRYCLTANSEPLYLRLPKTDAEGRNLGDFMMLLPGLRDLSHARLDERLGSLRALIESSDDIVFADLNLPLNLLWLSVKQRNGAIIDLSRKIRERFPEARLIGHTALERPQHRRGRGLLRLVARGFRRLALPLLERK